MNYLTKTQKTKKEFVMCYGVPAVESVGDGDTGMDIFQSSLTICIVRSCSCDDRHVVTFDNTLWKENSKIIINDKKECDPFHPFHLIISISSNTNLKRSSLKLLTLTTCHIN